MAWPYAWSCRHRAEAPHCISIRKQALIGRSGFHGSKAMAARRSCGVHEVRCHGAMVRSQARQLGLSNLCKLIGPVTCEESRWVQRLLWGSIWDAARQRCTRRGAGVLTMQHMSCIAHYAEVAMLWRGGSAHFRRYGGRRCTLHGELEEIAAMFE